MKGTNRLSIEEYLKGVIAHNRVMLSKAITLVESELQSDRLLADTLIEKLMPLSGKSIRVGITGAPGVGKSTLIEALGKHLTATGKKVAVLAVDPSSQKTKGSILGDKTRMEDLSKDVNAFIRPSAAGGTLGGVARHSRETILLCEAAGYEIVLVETVGVGQSETMVRDMTDYFLLLALPGAGDELQGIKKGIVEMADGIAITKADGDSMMKAKQAQRDCQSALHFFPEGESKVPPQVVLTSALTGEGISETWQHVEYFKRVTTANGFFQKQREAQSIQWFHEELRTTLYDKIYGDAQLSARMSSIESDINMSRISPVRAAREVFNQFHPRKASK
jgi:LAO/AO transport system kinase